MKKKAYRVLTVVLAVLVMLNTSVTGVFSEDANTNAVTPSAENYAFSDGTITGLKTEYLANLTTEQKQNIRLVIPSEINGTKVTKIGDKAFEVYSGTPTSQRYKDCSFISLDLSMVKNLEYIGDDAFYDCKISGNLTFPDSLITIGNNAFRQTNSFKGITGIVKFPPKLTTIGSVAFSYQSAITGIDLTQCNDLKGISASAFRYTGIDGVVTIPGNVQQIGKTAFASTKIETVYLPKRKDSANTKFIDSSSFQSIGKLQNIICADSTDYNFVAQNVSPSTKSAVTFPVTVTLYDQSRQEYGKLNRLYNRQYNYIKNFDENWKIDSAYKFPVLLDKKNEEAIWTVSQSSYLPAKETQNVKFYNLYAMDKVTEDPVITYGPDVDKEYDGTSPVLTVATSHPLKKTVSEAAVKDVIFQYFWHWNTINSTPEVNSGYDKYDSYNIGADVRAPYAISCYVIIKAYIMTGYNEKGNKVVKQFYEDSHEFAVNLRQAEPSVHPTVTSGTYQMSEGQTDLPDLELSAGDTKGTITWDKEQKLKEGFGTYTWTFTPAANGIDNNQISNFKTVKGQVELYATTEELNKKSLEEKIENIPVITEDKTPNDEERKKILDAYFAYESSAEEIKANISEESQEKIYEAINKLPQVAINAKGVQLGNEKELLKNITPQDVAIVKDLESAKCTFKVISKSTQPDETVKNAITQAAGSDVKIDNHFDVKVVKIIEASGQPASETLTTVKKPLRLVFAVPRTLQSGNRQFFVIRTHADAEGNLTATKLADEDNDPATITVTSDQFSIYAIAYAESPASGGSGGVFSCDITAAAGEHGAITPEGRVYAYYGSSRTFQFVPDAGYEISDVIVDGESVGRVAAYAFDHITKDHTISVTFQRVTLTDKEITAGVKATTIKVSSSVKKGAITIKWKKSYGFKVNYFQVFRSTKKNSGYGTKAFYQTSNGIKASYKNTKKLKKGTRYYYKVRGVRVVNGRKIYTKWSNKATKIAK